MGLDINFTKEIYVGGNYPHNKVEVKITKNGQDLGVVADNLLSVNVLIIPSVWKTHNFYELDDIINQYTLDSNEQCTSHTISNSGLQSVKKDLDKFIANPSEDTLLDIGTSFYGNIEMKSLLEVFTKVSNEIEKELEVADEEYTTYTYHRSF